VAEASDELWKWDQNGSSDKGARVDSGITGRTVPVHWRICAIPDQGYANVSFTILSLNSADTLVPI